MNRCNGCRYFCVEKVEQAYRAKCSDPTLVLKGEPIIQHSKVDMQAEYIPVSQPPWCMGWLEKE